MENIAIPDIDAVQDAVFVAPIGTVPAVSVIRKFYQLIFRDALAGLSDLHLECSWDVVVQPCLGWLGVLTMIARDGGPLLGLAKIHSNIRLLRVSGTRPS